MSIGQVSSLLRDGVVQTLLMSAPFLVSALVVGLVVAILQATTQIQEQTLTFFPKVVAILAVLALFGGFMMNSLGEYTKNLFRMIPNMAG